jgi:uncharacterized membrane protein
MKRWLGLTAAAALVLAGAFLPWATLRGTAQPAAGQFTRDPLGVEVTVTVWNGQVRYGEFEVPHIFVLMAAAVAAVAYWLRASGRRNVPIPLPAGMALCGLVHTLCFLVILFRSRAGSVGPGSVLTAVGMLTLLVLALCLPRPEQPAVPQQRGGSQRRARKRSRQRRP